jgi:hypothetical protein
MMVRWRSKDTGEGAFSSNTTVVVVTHSGD